MVSADLHIQEYGTGPVLVLGHGVIQDLSIFAPVVPLLADHFRVLLWDAPGHGGSPTRAGTYSHEELADDLAKALAERGINRAIVGGLSQGGWVAMQTALRHPGLVTALVLISCTAHAHDPAKMQAVRVGPRTWAQTGLTEAYIAYQTLMNLGPNSPHAEAWAADMNAFDAGKVEEIYEALLARPRLVERLKSLDVPALVIRGEHDEWVLLDEAEAMAEALGTTAHTVEGGWHTLTLTHPELVAEWILAWAREHSLT